MRLALAVVLLGGVAAVAPLAIIGRRDDLVLLGLPLTAFLSMLGAPLIIAFAAFWHVGRQRRVDLRHGVGED